MSTEVAAPLAAPIPQVEEVAPTEATSTVEQTSEVPQVEGQAEPTPAPATITEEPAVATPATRKEDHKKRSPFGDLKNKLWHKVSVADVCFLSHGDRSWENSFTR